MTGRTTWLGAVRVGAIVIGAAGLWASSLLWRSGDRGDAGLTVANSLIVVVYALAQRRHP